MESSSDLGTRGSGSTRGAYCSSLIVAGFFVWASVMKLLGPDEFGRVVWAVLEKAPSSQLAVGLGVALAGIELALALLLVIEPKRALWRKIGIVLLVVFCGVLVRLMFMVDPPSCGCLSINLGRGTSVEQITGLGRNVALIWLLLISMRVGSDERCQATELLPLAEEGAR